MELTAKMLESWGAHDDDLLYFNTYCGQGTEITAASMMTLSMFLNLDWLGVQLFGERFTTRLVPLTEAYRAAWMPAWEACEAHGDSFFWAFLKAQREAEWAYINNMAQLIAELSLEG